MLSQKAKYALKALCQLSAHPEGQLMLVSEIAEREQAPRKFLELILLDLKRYGLVFSQRGKNGGYALAKPASEITVGEVIRALDGPLAPLPCASLSGYRRCQDCSDEDACPVRLVMRQVRDAMAAIVDNISIAEAAETARGGRQFEHVLAE
ncbi:MAG: Rrf2 family transcriptional regulator [Rhodospirillales bacterium]|nr:Rrf2 family transcriptional regulator [Rhodospirillales bacterium]